MSCRPKKGRIRTGWVGLLLRASASTGLMGRGCCHALRAESDCLVCQVCTRVLGTAGHERRPPSPQ